MKPITIPCKVIYVEKDGTQHLYCSCSLSEEDTHFWSVYSWNDEEQLYDKLLANFSTEEVALDYVNSLLPNMESLD